MASVIQYVESISGALEGQPSKLGYEVRKARKAAAAIAPGRFVCRSSTDYDCKVPTTVAEVLASIGATVLADTIALNDDGNYASGKRIPIFSKAPGLWMVTIDAATEGGQVYVNYAGANPAGSVSAAFVSGENVALPGARFGSTQATPGGLVEVMFSCPTSAPALAGALTRTLAVIVTYDGSGVPTIGAQAGVTITDTATGVFKLTVAGAASVIPLGSPIKLKATPDSSDAPVSVFEVEVIAATEVTFSHRVVQSDATPAGDAADPANGDKIYVGLLVTYA
jgi:hypothetical protein